MSRTKTVVQLKKLKTCSPFSTLKREPKPTPLIFQAAFVLDLDAILQVVAAGLETDLRVASRLNRIEDRLHVVTRMDHKRALA